VKPIPASATVVLDVEQGGIVVPSFIGKSVRSAIEMAENSGLDLDAEGSGLAREQVPAAGSRVATGSRIMVRFGR
jgi:cell division protein FtsI (penicillin-binding protein 3)